MTERTPKQQAALNLLLERYATALEEQIWKTKLTPSQRRAIIRAGEHYWDLREELSKSKQYQALSCVCKIDRVILTASDVDLKTILNIDGYRKEGTKPKWRRGQDYSYVWILRGDSSSSIKEITIAFQPTKGWLPRHRITICPRDSSGPQLTDLLQIWSLLLNPRISLVEVAWDFPADTIIDLQYVRRFGLYGKTQVMWGKKLHAGKAGNAFHEKFGSRNPKIVRTYFKWEIWCFRIELQLHTLFLQKEGITNPDDIVKLAYLLIPDHLTFARLNHSKLQRSLEKRSLRQDLQKEIAAIAKRKAQTRLWEALRYLRQGPARLQNVRRNTEDITEINDVLRAAAKTWAKQWRRKQ